MSARPSHHSIQVPRTARIATLGTPSSAAVWWIVLHGYGQQAHDFIQPFASVVTSDRCVVAPEGLSRFYVDGLESHEDVGASWMTQEARQDEIRDYLAYLDAVVQYFREEGDGQSIRVLGFSQGAATASRWAVRGDTAMDRLVLWGGAPAQDLDLEAHADRLRALDLTLVLGTEDPYVTDERRAAVRSRLNRQDIPVTVHTFDGGHRLDSDTLTRVIEDRV